MTDAKRQQRRRSPSHVSSLMSPRKRQSSVWLRDPSGEDERGLSLWVGKKMTRASINVVVSETHRALLTTMQHPPSGLADAGLCCTCILAMKYVASEPHGPWQVFVQRLTFRMFLCFGATSTWGGMHAFVAPVYLPCVSRLKFLGLFRATSASRTEPDPCLGLLPLKSKTKSVRRRVSVLSTSQAPGGLTLRIPTAASRSVPCQRGQ